MRDIDHEDNYRLASRPDDCMDLMEAAADLIVLYRLDGLSDAISAQAQVLACLSVLSAGAMPRMPRHERPAGVLEWAQSF